jgi:hypothetical protein
MKIRKLVEDYVQKECSCKVFQMFPEDNEDWIVNRRKSHLHSYKKFVKSK